MNEILSRQFSPDDLEPELVRLVTPIARKWEAAALRVAAHHEDPAKFVLPKSKNAPETILAQRFEQLDTVRPERARIAGLRAVDQLSVPKTEKKLGEALALDFTRSVSVDDLIIAPSQPITKEGMLNLVDRQYAHLGMQRTTSGAPSPHKNVNLDLLRVVCVDETNGLFGSELGEDEISLSGLTIDESANADKIPIFEVADDFDDGDRKDFSPPKRLFTFKVGGGTSYPKHYFATLLLFETDQGDLDETMEKLLRKFADEVVEKVTVWLGGAAGNILGGPLGAVVGGLVGRLVGWLINHLINRIIAIWEDDVFIPRTLELIIPSATAILSQPSQVFHFRGPGEYAVRYRWSVA